jgi:hydroxyethylthiazole kinase
MLFGPRIDFLSRIKSMAPLVLCLTNYVTVNECANGLLAIGASPVMSDCLEDAVELATVADATVINIGTLNPVSLEIMIKSAQAALKAGKPVIFDPVGVGATKVRMEASERILKEVSPTVIKGNVSEILALCGLVGEQKGVDSTVQMEEIDLFRKSSIFAKQQKAVVVITGPVDLITDGSNDCRFEGGTPLMTKLTGTGCLLSAIVGAYVGVGAEEPFEASYAAIRHMATAGEKAKKELDLFKNNGIGTFKTLLFDQLNLITSQEVIDAY